MAVFTEVGTFEVLNCGKCSIAFGMPKAKYDRCKQYGEDFYCPNGHCRVFTKSEVQELRDQLNRANSDTQYWRQRMVDESGAKRTVERRLAAQKGQVTKIKKRIGHGVCPCCNRTFQNVARHMENRHPEWSETSN